jgi:hypothetical protein
VLDFEHSIAPPNYQLSVILARADGKIFAVGVGQSTLDELAGVAIIREGISRFIAFELVIYSILTGRTAKVQQTT